MERQVIIGRIHRAGSHDERFTFTVIPWASWAPDRRAEARLEYFALLMHYLCITYGKRLCRAGFHHEVCRLIYRLPYAQDIYIITTIISSHLIYLLKSSLLSALSRSHWSTDQLMLGAIECLNLICRLLLNLIWPASHHSHPPLKCNFASDTSSNHGARCWELGCLSADV